MQWRQKEVRMKLSSLWTCHFPIFSFCERSWSLWRHKDQKCQKLWAYLVNCRYYKYMQTSAEIIWGEDGKFERQIKEGRKEKISAPQLERSTLWVASVPLSDQRQLCHFYCEFGMRMTCIPRIGGILSPEELLNVSNIGGLLWVGYLNEA